MIPRGCIYLEPEGLQRVSREIFIDEYVIIFCLVGNRTIEGLRSCSNRVVLQGRNHYPTVSYIFISVHTRPGTLFPNKEKGKSIMRILRIRGAVFIKEDLVELVGAWKVCYKRWKDEERKV